jgi:hypothetical protein
VKPKREWLRFWRKESPIGNRLEYPVYWVEILVILQNRRSPAERDWSSSRLIGIYSKQKQASALQNHFSSFFE